MHDDLTRALSVPSAAKIVRRIAIAQTPAHNVSVVCTESVISNRPPRPRCETPPPCPHWDKTHRQVARLWNRDNNIWNIKKNKSQIITPISRPNMGFAAHFYKFVIHSYKCVLQNVPIVISISSLVNLVILHSSQKKYILKNNYNDNDYDTSCNINSDKITIFIRQLQQWYIKKWSN